MSTSYIPSNSAPFHMKTGYHDQSVPPLVRSPVGDPIHKPWIMGFAARGREDEAFPLSGDNLLSFAGRDVVDFRSKYATFVTPFLRMFNTNANDVIFQRVCPEDATTAMHRVVAEVYKQRVAKYKRTLTGGILYENGSPVVETEIDGLVILIRHEDINDQTGKFGLAQVHDGDIVGSDGAKSKIYPLWDVKAPYRGEDANGFGYRLCVPSPTTSPTITAEYVKEVGARVYNIQFVETLSGVSSPVVWPTLTGTNSLMFSFKEGAYHEKTRLELDFDNVVPTGYQKRNPDVGMIPDYGPFEKFFVYKDHLEEVQKLGLAAIATNRPSTHELVDIFQGLDLNGNPYDGLVVNPSSATNRVIFNDRHVHYLKGGSDGTMTDAVYDELVRRELMLFPDRGAIRFDDELKYSLGIFWDCGYSLETKEAAVNFISRSRNTFLGLCTFIYDEPHTEDRDQQMQREESMKIVLNELVSQAPESSVFGTPATRGLIMGQSGVLRNSSYRKRLPLIYSLANMFSKYMGSSQGECKPAYRFSNGKETIIRDLTDVTLPWKGNTVYASDWDANLISASSYNMWEVHIKAIQSIYNEERSVLNNALVAFILTYVYRVADRVWADNTGENRRTPQEIAKDIQNEIVKRLAGRLDEIVSIDPVAYFTDEDISAGNSISLDLNASGTVLFTRLNTTIRVFRRE